VTIIILKKPTPKLPAPAPVGGTTADEIAALIDAIGAMLPAVEARQTTIKALLKELQPYAEKMKALTALVSAIEGRGADETFHYEGTQFNALVGKRCVVRAVTDPALAIKLLNRAEKGVAWKLISVPLGKLDAFLTPKERARVIKVDRGERSVVIVKKPVQEGA
jgi:hypothetical protein